MYYKGIVLLVYLVCVSGNGIYHENTKVTFSPQDADAEYFGFSVILNRYSLIVGAPKTKYGLKRSGLAFNCSLESLDPTNGVDPKTVGCISWPGIQQSPVEVIGPGMKVRDDNMWYGATIASLSDDKLLICGPRFTQNYGPNHLLAHGVCVIQRRKGRNSIINPLSEKARQAFMTDGNRREYGDYGTHLNFYAYGQAGMSIKVIGNTSVIIGAPGLLQWTGGIIHFVYNAQEGSTYFSKQVIPNPYYTNELGPDDYFGYSVEAGVFQHDAKPLFIGGAPRSARGYGQVLLFEPSAREHAPLTIQIRLRGPQLGAYFGASICCLDIDGDGISDMLVGAPNYVIKNGGLPYDQGAVFVYMTKTTRNRFNLEPSGQVMGSGASGARFGTAIADLGDVDGDGFTDVAIGAPWENDEAGVVYIYRGSSKGLRAQYVQKISAKGARSFGISISKGFDIDQNKCNDIAVGAAKSSTVYLYRCVPTVTVQASIKVPDAMNLPQNVTGFTALFCVTGLECPQWNHVTAKLKKRIVIDPEENRAQISGNADYNVSISPGYESCEEHTVDVKPTADLSKPISIQFFLEVIELFKNDSTVFNRHAARVSEDSILESSFLIQLIRDCGEDMICTPWLEMTFEAFSERYTPGSSDRLGATLTISNTAEPAYGARVNITLPSPPKRLPSPCSLEELVLTCDVPAPLLRNESVFWDIELEYKESSEMFMMMSAELHDPLYNRNISKESSKEVILEITPIAVINVAGKSIPNDTVTVAREKLYNAKDILFSHYIEISNFGPSNWILLEFVITLPKWVNLSIPIKGCDTVDTTMLECAWSAPAKVSRSVVLPLRFDMAQYGELLKLNTTLNLTTEIEITDSVDGNRTASIMTTLVLDPAPPIWPLILGIVAGLILLAVIVYLLHRYGFFSRQQREKLKKLQEQTEPLVLDTTSSTGSQGSPSMEADESTHELLCDDSD